MVDDNDDDGGGADDVDDDDYDHHDPPWGGVGQICLGSNVERGVQTHTCTHARTHPRTHTRTYTRTHAHTHIHTHNKRALHRQGPGLKLLSACRTCRVPPGWALTIRSILVHYLDVCSSRSIGWQEASISHGHWLSGGLHASWHPSLLGLLWSCFAMSTSASPSFFCHLLAPSI